MPSHVHKWEALKRGFPQRVCRCGSLHATELKIGKNTITLSPAGVGDVARWSATQNALAAGDIGMNVLTGRPQAFIQGENRDLPFGDETYADGRRRIWAIQQNAGLTTLSQVGFATAPTVNTPGAAAVVHNVATGEGQFVEYSTGATLNADAGIISTAFSQSQRIYRYIYDLAMRTGPDIANVRFWLGLFSATPMASAVPAVSYTAFRYDTAADGTAFWRCVTDSGTGAPTVTVTTTPIAVDTSYRLRIIWLTGTTTVLFFINGVQVASHTTTIPATTTDLGHVEQVRALAAADKKFRFGRVAVFQNSTIQTTP
jgi:hypothetical protein